MVIDNYDSYTHLISYYLWQINQVKPIVIKNDAMDIFDLKNLQFDNIVLSPGPGNPMVRTDTNLCKEILNDEDLKRIPILGVCLGHQLIGCHYGAAIKRAPVPMHGKCSRVVLGKSALFEGMEETIEVMRYHSLILDHNSIDMPLEITAKTHEKIALPMGIQHQFLPLFGVQFHPESIGTKNGMQIFKNFNNIISKKQIHKKGFKSQEILFITKKVKCFDLQEVFEKIYLTNDYQFWLDSSEISQNGKYSFMGDPSVVIMSDKNHQCNIQKLQKSLLDRYLNRTDVKQKKPLDMMEHIIKTTYIKSDSSQMGFKGGFVGYVNYEYAKELNYPIKNKPNHSPDLAFMWVETFLAFDHEKQECFICSLGETLQECTQRISQLEKKLTDMDKQKEKLILKRTKRHFEKKLPLSLDSDKNEYLAKIEKIKDLLKQGETYEICLTNEFKFVCNIDPFYVYKVLRLSNPAPYSAFFSFTDFSILSSSIECFFRMDVNGKIISEPIKGTRAKGKNKQETEKIALDLQTCEKEKAELLMITDLIRNDMSQFCERKSLNVQNISKVTEYETVLQLSSLIEGKIDKQYTAFDVLRSMFPGGSITGAPKYRSMKWIDELENRPRGVYTGSIGYFSVDGAATFNIAIRTMLYKKQSHEYLFGSGGAIIYDSDPESEFNEVLLKAYALICAINLAYFGKFENIILETKYE